ncbi:MAG: GNAT family N-acetyltransferase [Clostridia bacterium]|jgi:hypothetical protein|nr:GNAT family N-acetyltransferase [Clostridia bacterium]
MAFLTDRCARVPLSPKIVAACAPFSCGNKDLDEFFSADYLDYAEQLMGKTYAFLEIENPSEIVCAFTVSNASIFTNHLPNARRKRVGKDVPWQKRDMIYPAVLIGRLGVNRKFMRKHVGTELMQSIKSWFVDEDNKTGCRYLVVDAYNEDIPIRYYRNNGFDFMFSTEEQEKQYRNISGDSPLNTRLMFFDLMQIAAEPSAAV